MSTETSPTTETKTKTRQMSFTVLADGTIHASFGPGLEPLSLNPAAVPESLHVAAITDGLISRARGYTSKLLDEDRTPENLRAAIEKAFNAFRMGVWKVERTHSSSEEYTQEVRAAFGFRKSRAESKNEAFTDTIAEVAAHWEALGDDQKKQVKALPRYQLALAAVKAADAAAKQAALEKKIAESGSEDEVF